MVSLLEIVYNIKNIAYAGNISDDTNITDNLIAFWVSNARSKLIKQTINKNQDIPWKLIQSVDLEMDIVDISSKTYQDQCLNLGCSVLMSKQPIPSTVSSAHGNGIMSVSTFNNNEIPLINYAFSRYNQHLKYTKKMRKAFINNGYLFVINDLALTYVRVRGVFESPEELSAYNICNGVTMTTSNCFSWDSEYPITEDMVYDITNMVLAQRFNIVMGTKTDAVNDSSGIIQQQRIPNINGGGDNSGANGES